MLGYVYTKNSVNPYEVYSFKYELNYIRNF